MLVHYADNWSVKAIRRKTTGTGRMRYLRNVPRRFKTNFREGLKPLCPFLYLDCSLVAWDLIYKFWFRYRGCTKEEGCRSCLCLGYYYLLNFVSVMDQRPLHFIAVSHFVLSLCLCSSIHSVHEPISILHPKLFMKRGVDFYTLNQIIIQICAIIVYEMIYC